MITETPNIFPAILQAIAQQDLPVLSTQSSETSDISYDSDYDPFPTKWDNYQYANHAIHPIGIHSKYPFLHIFRIPYSLTFGIPKEVFPLIWYLCHLHTIIIEFPAPSFHIALHAKFSNPPLNLGIK